jgi:hypothetical protein
MTYKELELELKKLKSTTTIKELINLIGQLNNPVEQGILICWEKDILLIADTLDIPDDLIKGECEINLDGDDLEDTVQRKAPEMIELLQSFKKHGVNEHPHYEKALNEYLNSL